MTTRYDMNFINLEITKTAAETATYMTVWIPVISALAGVLLAGAMQQFLGLATPEIRETDG